MVDFNLHKQDAGLTSLAVAASGSSYTWANRPNILAVPVGFVFIASDVGVGRGVRFVSDGTNWIPDGVFVLGRQNTQVVAPIDANENTLYSLNIPGGLMGPNGSLRVSVGYGQSNNANVKTFRINFGGSNAFFIQASINFFTVIVGSITNRNSLSAQINRNGATTAGTSVGGITAVNTAVDQTLTITGQKAVGSDTLSLESILVELLP